MSARLAEAQSVTGWRVKNGVSIVPTDWTCSPIPGLLGQAAQPACQLLGADLQRRPDLRLPQLAERGDAGCHRQGVARERPGLVDRPGRRDHFHDLAPAAVGADRQAAADHLAQRRQVRLDAGRAPGRRPGATRKPVITSSKISSAPERAVISRSPGRKSASGGTTPMLPATGSTITAAI